MSGKKPALRLVRAFACVLLFCVLGQGQVQAATSNRANQKKHAEAERAELQQKLKALKKDINKTETARDKASDALEDSEQLISEANRSLRDLQTEQAQTAAKLKSLQQEQNRLAAQVEKQKNQLSEFLRRQYIRGESDRMKLLLSGDNPNRISRDLQYMGYVSQTQAKMIEQLRVSLLAAEENARNAAEAKAELDEIAQEEREHKTALEVEKKRRSQLLGQLASKLHAQKKEADHLQKDEQRLSSLVSRLKKIMEDQVKAEQEKAAEQERQRIEKLALEQAQKKKKQLNQTANQQNKSGKISNPNAIDADVAPNVSNVSNVSNVPNAAKATVGQVSKIEQTPVAGSQNGAAFSSLKGQLHLPVIGELVARFGSKRGDGPSWKGLFIKAPEGAEIKAIAAGKVVFAEWLRGFGNMIIVDHGNQYLSLYSNNQAVLKRAGDAVKVGETIASAGNSGGNEESGLYFELRHQGRVFDPLTWVKK